MAKESDSIIRLRQQARELSERPRNERNNPIPKKLRKKIRKSKKKQSLKQDEYSRLLKTVMWNDKRKEILHRDRYCCVNCGSKKNLQVHHIKYVGKPWECPNEFLITLCKNCHKSEHAKIRNKHL